MLEPKRICAVCGEGFWRVQLEARRRGTLREATCFECCLAIEQGTDDELVARNRLAPWRSPTLPADQLAMRPLDWPT